MAFKREDVVRNAEKYVAKGKIEAGIKEYRKVLKENPNDSNTLNRLGDLYARISQTDEAIRLFTQIAEQYAQDGFLVKSIAIYKKIIRLEPTRLAAYEKLAELYAGQGLLNDARSQYQVLGDYYLKHGDSAAAINVFQKMAEVEPDNPSHQLKLAELYQEQKLWDRATKAYCSIAELMLEHGRAEEAVRVYRRAFEIHPEDLEFLDGVLGDLRRRGLDGPAGSLLAAAVEVNPEASRLQSREEPSLPPAEPVFAAGEVEEIGAPAEPSELATEGEAGELAAEDATIGDDFVLDFDDDSSTSMVAPPPDMVEPGSAFQDLDAATTRDGDDAFELEMEEGLGSIEELGGIELGAGPAPSPEPVAEPPDVSSADALSGEFELELELDGPEEVAWSFEPPEPTRAPGVGSGSRTAAVEEEEPARILDLLAEAEVFAKYGLEEKAHERIAQILEQDPDQVEARRLRLDLLLRAGEHGAAAAEAPRLREAASERGRLDIWEEASQRLGAAGLDLPELASEGSEAVEAAEASSLGAGPELEELVPSGELDLELEAELEPGQHREPGSAAGLPSVPAPGTEAASGRDLAASSGTAELQPPAEASAAPPEATRARKPRSIEDALAALTSEVLERPGRRAAPTPPPSPVAASAGEAVAPPPIAEPALPDVDDELPDVVFPEERASEEARIDDTDMGWLDEVPAAGPAPEGAAEDRLFEDEDEFFDLAAELEEELEHEEGTLGGDILAQPAEPSLEEIVEGFKRGVAENLSAEDYDTHYNLGIAYREMGLLDEAINEFQVAAKDPAHLVDCCSMLGLCFLEKGLPELAVKWYRRGLEAPGIPDETLWSLMYELGDAHLAAGDEAAARQAFVELYGISSGYRDVAMRVQELGG